LNDVLTRDEDVFADEDSQPIMLKGFLHPYKNVCDFNSLHQFVAIDHVDLVKDVAEHTVLGHYLRQNYPIVETIKWLLELGSDPKMTNSHGVSCLHSIFMKEDRSPRHDCQMHSRWARTWKMKDSMLEVVQMFVDYGASIFAIDKDGLSVSDYAFTKYRGMNWIHWRRIYLELGINEEEILTGSVHDLGMRAVILFSNEIITKLLSSNLLNFNVLEPMMYEHHKAHMQDHVAIDLTQRYNQLLEKTSPRGSVGRIPTATEIDSLFEPLLSMSCDSLCKALVEDIYGPPNTRYTESHDSLCMEFGEDIYRPPDMWYTDSCFFWDLTIHIRNDNRDYKHGGPVIPSRFCHYCGCPIHKMDDFLMKDIESTSSASFYQSSSTGTGFDISMDLGIPPLQDEADFGVWSGRVQLPPMSQNFHSLTSATLCPGSPMKFNMEFDQDNSWRHVSKVEDVQFDQELDFGEINSVDIWRDGSSV